MHSTIYRMHPVTKPEAVGGCYRNGLFRLFCKVNGYRSTKAQPDDRNKSRKTRLRSVSSSINIRQQEGIGRESRIEEIKRATRGNVKERRVVARIPRRGADFSSDLVAFNLSSCFLSRRLGGDRTRTDGEARQLVRNDAIAKSRKSALIRELVKRPNMAQSWLSRSGYKRIASTPNLSRGKWTVEEIFYLYGLVSTPICLLPGDWKFIGIKFA